MKAPLLDVLRCKFPDSSNNSLRKLLRQKRVLLNGTLLSKNSNLSSSQPITLLPKKTFFKNTPILYKDAHLVVVEKKEGLLSVSTHYEKKKTLHAQLKELYTSVWPVQRLDKDTSGVIVFALSKAAKEGLKTLFQNHDIYREYRALVKGCLKGSGTWKHKIQENKDTYLMQIDKQGSMAITHYQAIRSGPKHSLMQFILKTGKKNQIRVQASFSGYPILGDKKYGSCPCFLGRMALHAYKLQFVHPISKKPLSFISPSPF